jgi:DNA polymerase-3 subunit gamma/tau
MAYISLYRKYRSQTFGDLVGQDHVVKTLQSAVESGRIAHAYLFTGPRGTGKTSSARLLAKALNAENGPTPTPSDDDPICQMIAAGTCPDVLEFDAASEAGVENVREAIVENAQYMPMMCRYKIFIIDEVHDLSSKAFDALLKTIEEPPSHIIFILATTEYNKVPPTIRSRCQKFEFHRASLSDLVKRLEYVAQEEKIDIEPGAINAIARMADGGYRDALTLLEQAMLTSDGKVTLVHIYDQLGLVSEETVDAILTAIKGNDVPKIIEQLNEVYRLGRDPRAILESMIHRLADLTRAAYGIDIGGTQDAAQEAALHATAALLGREFLLDLRGSLSEAHKSIREVTLPRLWLESELIKSTTPKTRNQPANTTTKSAAKPNERAAEPVQKPEPVKSEKSEPEAKPKPEPVRKPDPAPIPDDLDPIEKAWREAVVELSVVSKLMAARLADARVGNADGKTLYVEFSRQLDLDWFKEGQKRAPALVEALRNRLGDDWKIELGVGKRENAKVETQAVELPLEGQKLAETVREIFGAN